MLRRRALGRQASSYHELSGKLFDAVKYNHRIAGTQHHLAFDFPRSRRLNAHAIETIPNARVRSR